MTTLAPRFQAYCPRCQSIIRVPESMPLSVFSRAPALRHAGQTMQAISAVAGSGCTDLTEAKRFVFHLTAQPGHCHRCRKPLTAGSPECALCHSVNMDFTAAA